MLLRVVSDLLDLALNHLARRGVGTRVTHDTVAK
jgi:hypothetical protein